MSLLEERYTQKTHTHTEDHVNTLGDSYLQKSFQKKTNPVKTLLKLLAFRIVIK